MLLGKRGRGELCRKKVSGVKNTSHRNKIWLVITGHVAILEEIIESLGEKFDWFTVQFCFQTDIADGILVRKTKHMGKKSRNNLHPLYFVTYINMLTPSSACQSVGLFVRLSIRLSVTHFILVKARNLSTEPNLQNSSVCTVYSVSFRHSQPLIISTNNSWRKPEELSYLNWFLATE